MAKIAVAAFETMTPEQRAETADKIEALEGDQHERKMFASVAVMLRAYPESPWKALAAMDDENE
jgi:hypothetical protein